jgi:O-antigen ligase
VRRAALSASRLLLLVGPTVLAFFTGGYFEGPRAWAGLLAWLLVVIAVVLGTRGIPRYRGAVLSLAGLTGLALLSLLSMLWAPVASDAYQASQIVVLYLGTLLASALLFDQASASLIEPVLAAGTTIVIGYGLAGRLLPGLLHYARSASANGRLEQPLTYWNAMGELAALGLVLCARIAGDRSRPAWLRVVAAGALAPLGMGLYVSFSRGALFAGAAGLLTLLVLAPRRQQAAAVGLAVGAAVLGAAVAAPFGGVTGLTGSLSSREQDGAIALGLLVVLTLLSAGAAWYLMRRIGPGDFRLPPRAPAIATAVVCVGLAAAILLGSKESSTGSQQLSGGSSRLVTLQSNRYDYWRVALRAFGTEPIRGVGAGNWSVYWLRWRTIVEGAQDTHSLPLQTMAELGLLGLAVLVAFFAGVALAAQRALRAGSLAVGPVAGFVVYAAHAPLDWDWQMPAVTLIAIVLAGALLSLGGAEAEASAMAVSVETREPAPATA